MNTGHGGTMSTVHANNPRETLSRMESLALLADVGLPLRALRAQVAAAVDLVVSTSRLRDGSRRVMAISEVLFLDDHGDYRVNDLFLFEQRRSAQEGRIEGEIRATGNQPTFRQQLVNDGHFDMVPTFFDPHATEPPSLGALYEHAVPQAKEELSLADSTVPNANVNALSDEDSTTTHQRRGSAGAYSGRSNGQGLQSAITTETPPPLDDDDRR
jgi:hypothetical protein